MPFQKADRIGISRLACHHVPMDLPPLDANRIRLLLDSHRHWLKRELIPRSGAAEEDARRLFDAPLVVVSHGTEPDPVFWFGNRRALELFEMDWSSFTRLPSRYSAEPVNREERARLLAEVTQHGHIANYQGVRISSSGNRFRIAKAVVWNLIDEGGSPAGQAAAFSDWTPIPRGGSGA